MTGPGQWKQWASWTRRTEEHIRTLAVKQELEKILQSEPVSFFVFSVHLEFLIWQLLL